MRSALFPSVWCVAALAICGCSRSSTGLSRTELKAVHARIDSMNAIYDTCVRAHEMAFFQEWYMPDACSMPEGMPRVCGREAIAEFRWNHGDSRVFRLLLKAEEVSGGPDVVAEQGNYVVSTAGAALDKGKYIALWRRDADGKWKVHREIWNSDIPHDAPPDTLSKIEG